jgi:hypothetical protein
VWQVRCLQQQQQQQQWALLPASTAGHSTSRAAGCELIEVYMQSCPVLLQNAAPAGESLCSRLLPFCQQHLPLR